MSSDIEGDWYLLIEDAPMNDATPRLTLAGGVVTKAGIEQGRYEADGEEVRVSIHGGERLVLIARGDGVLSGNLVSPIPGDEDMMQPVALVRGVASAG